MQYEDLKESLEDAWKQHVTKCERCKQFDKTKPATLAIVCLQGAPFIKQILEKEARAAASKRSRAQNKMWRESEEGKHIRSKTEVNAATRYK